MPFSTTLTDYREIYSLAPPGGGSQPGGSGSVSSPASARPSLHHDATAGIQPPLPSSAPPQASRLHPSPFRPSFPPTDGRRVVGVPRGARSAGASAPQRRRRPAGGGARGRGCWCGVAAPAAPSRRWARGEGGGGVHEVGAGGRGSRRRRAHGGGARGRGCRSELLEPPTHPPTHPPAHLPAPPPTHHPSAPPCRPSSPPPRCSRTSPSCCPCPTFGCTAGR